MIYKCSKITFYLTIKLVLSRWNLVFQVNFKLCTNEFLSQQEFLGSVTFTALEKFITDHPFGLIVASFTQVWRRCQRYLYLAHVYITLWGFLAIMSLSTFKKAVFLLPLPLLVKVDFWQLWIHELCNESGRCIKEDRTVSYSMDSWFEQIPLEVSHHQAVHCCHGGAEIDVNCYHLHHELSPAHAYLLLASHYYFLKLSKQLCSKAASCRQFLLAIYTIQSLGCCIAMPDQWTRSTLSWHTAKG